MTQQQPPVMRVFHGPGLDCGVQGCTHGHGVTRTSAVLAPPLRNPSTGGTAWFHGASFDPEGDDESGQRPEPGSEHNLTSPHLPAPGGGQHDPGGEVRPPEEHNPEYGGFETGERIGHHWNTDLGSHFSSLQSVAKGFASGQYGGGGPHARVLHAGLHMANPKHYADETEMAHDAIRWAHANGHKFLGNEAEEGDHERFIDGEFGSDSEEPDGPIGEHLDYLHEHTSPTIRSQIVGIHRHGPMSYGDRAEHLEAAEHYLGLHPEREEVTEGFRRHLKDQGHDGIVYGNDHEGPQGHACAIAFPDTPVHQRKWDWRHPSKQHLNEPEPHSPEPMPGQGQLPLQMHSNLRVAVRLTSGVTREANVDIRQERTDRGHRLLMDDRDTGERLGFLEYAHGPDMLRVLAVQAANPSVARAMFEAAQATGHWDIPPQSKTVGDTTYSYEHAPTGHGHAIAAHDRDGNHLGLMDLYRDADEDGSHEVARLQVHPAYRRQGVATGMWNYAKEIGLRPRHSEEQTAAGRDWAAKTATVLTDWRPTERLFAPTKGDVDPVLFDNTDRHMWPKVREEILSVTDGFFASHGYGARPAWARVYLAGSQASEWWGNRDFDILIGIDYPAYRMARPQDAALSDKGVDDRFNTQLREDFNDDTWHPNFDPTHAWSRTGYVNHDSWDIRKIHPYAAYNVTDDAWAVDPIDEPVGHTFRDSEWYYFEGTAEEARNALALPEPARTLRCTQIWQHVHSDRSRAFGPGGSGAFDRGNALEKYLDQAPSPYSGVSLMQALANERYGKPQQKTAAKPIPTHDENMTDAVLKQHSRVNFGSESKHFHQMTPEEFAAQPGTLWHGSPNGKEGMRSGSFSGIHVGTQEAARQALNARIGTPQHGDWDGQREYGKTHLVPGSRTGYACIEHRRKPWADGEPRLPSGEATYSDMKTKIPSEAKPDLFPVRVVGEMSNTTSTPHSDAKANGMMAGQIKKGNPRRGYYYANEGEDYGSISAVVPKRSHLATHEDFVRHALQNGRSVPQHNIDRYGLSEGQKTAGLFGPSWYETATDDKIDAHPARDSIRADMTEHRSPQGHVYRLTHDSARYVTATYLGKGDNRIKKPQVVGRLSWFGGQANDQNSIDGRIHKVFVKPAHRRRGLASAMLDHARAMSPNDDIEHSSALTDDGKAWSQKKAGLDDDRYQMDHRPPSGEDGDGMPIHDLTANLPDDVYTHPHYYSDMSEPSNHDAHAVLRRVRNKPEAKVRIYRALPAEHAHQGIQPGDWVTTSKEYAKNHGKHATDPKHDWPVVSASVPAKHLHTDGDDLREYGYNGPEAPHTSVAYRGGYHQQISQKADGSISKVQRRPESPIKGYSLMSESGSYDDHMAGRGGVSAYGPEGDYAGHLRWDKDGITAEHVDPEHRHVEDHLKKKMRSFLKGNPTVQFDPKTASQMTAPDDLTITREYYPSGGSKYGHRYTLSAKDADGEEQGWLRYHEPKRKGSPIHVEEVRGHAPGVASHLLNHMESLHPEASRTEFLGEKNRRNKNTPGHHDGEHGKPTDWDQHYDALGEIHRGFSVRLDPRDARTVVSPEHPADEHVKALQDKINESNAGIHWTAGLQEAKNFAGKHQYDHRVDVPVILHAQKPARKDIETRPNELFRNGVFPHDHLEKEVPVRRGRDVQLTGMSWKPDTPHPEADEDGWLHHTFEQPITKRAYLDDAEEDQ